MSRNHLSLEERIIERLRKPGSLKVIAKEIGISHGTIYRTEYLAIQDGRLDEKHRRIDKTGITREEKEEVERAIIERARSTTKSIAEIARYANISLRITYMIINRAIEKGKLEPQYRRLKVGHGLVQWQYDEVVKQIREKQKNSGDINFRRIGLEMNLRPRRIKRIYNDAVKKGLIESLTENGVDKIIQQLPRDIRKEFFNLSKKEREELRRIINRYTSYMIGKKSTEYPNKLESKSLRELIDKIRLAPTAREIAKIFIDSYDPKNSQIPKRSIIDLNEKFFYVNLERLRLRPNWKKEKFEYFLSLLDEPLRREIEDILSERRLARHVAKEFVDLFDKENPEGEKYSLLRSYTLTNFLTWWDGKRFNTAENHRSIYYNFLSRLRTKTQSHKQEGYIPVLLDMLNDDSNLRRQVEEIVTGERYRQELRQGGLEEAIEEYISLP